MYHPALSPLSLKMNENDPPDGWLRSPPSYDFSPSAQPAQPQPAYGLYPPPPNLQWQPQMHPQYSFMGPLYLIPGGVPPQHVLPPHFPYQQTSSQYYAPPYPPHPSLGPSSGRTPIVNPTPSHVAHSSSAKKWAWMRQDSIPGPSAHVPADTSAPTAPDIPQAVKEYFAEHE